VTLFKRTNRTTCLTTAGSLFLEQAASAIAILDSAQRDLAPYRSPRESVALGHPPTAIPEGFPAFLAGFHREQPLTEVKLIEGMTKRLFEQLRSGELDLSFVTGSAGNRPADLDWFEIDRQEMGFVTATSHPLAHSGVIDLTSIPEMQIVVLKEGFVVRDIAEEVFRRIGLPLKVAFETSEPEVMFSLVRAGVGYTLNSRIRATKHGLAFSKCTPAPLDHVVALAWSRSRSLSSASLLLRDGIRAFDDLVGRVEQRKRV